MTKKKLEKIYFILNGISDFGMVENNVVNFYWEKKYFCGNLKRLGNLLKYFGKSGNEKLGKFSKNLEKFEKIQKNK